MRVAVWILGDQLLEQHPALAVAEAEASRENLCVVLIESHALARRMRYQRKKLVLLFSSMRHYSNSLLERGYQVDHVNAGNMLSGLRHHMSEWKPQRIYTMAASQFAGRLLQERLAEVLGVPVAVLPNTQFLSGQFDPLPEKTSEARVVMENFYRAMRRHFNLLLEPDGSPLGGQWNYDSLNRQKLPADIELPERKRFEPDEITLNVMEEIERADYGIGSAQGFDLAVTHAQAAESFDDFLEHRLVNFGPYEDAMSSAFPLLFHSLLSPYINIGLLEPLPVVRAVEARYHRGLAPIQSVEGFIRQVVGWREYIYWQYWRLMPDLQEANFWGAQRTLPAFFWDGDTDMHCLSSVISRALEHGYSHHIERLMVVSNYCLLAGIAPKQVNDWFTVCYVDAYEWVMLPNVLGMGLYADGGLIATKPYIASAKYINKMSDYCSSCRHQPRVRSGEGACPFNLLYWNFLLMHEQVLRSNPRMGPNVLSLRHIQGEERRLIRRRAEEYLQSVSSEADEDPA